MRRSWGIWLLLAVAIVITSLLLGGGRVDGPPLDPRSTSQLGTRALIELIESYGMSADVGDSSLLAADTDVNQTSVLVLRDSMTPEARADLLTAVRRGLDVLVIDPGSPLIDLATRGSFSDQIATGDCAIDELADLGQMESESFLLYTELAAGDLGCFGTGGNAHIVQRGIGDGTLTFTGGAGSFTNSYLDEADNAVVLVRLLDPAPGRRLIVLYERDVVASDRTLSDLISSSVRWFGLQLLLVFGAVVLWRARRFGGVVDEPQLVELPGSLSVLASGELRRRARDHAAASVLIRGDFEERLRHHHRFTSDHSTQDVLNSLADRFPDHRERLASILLATPAGSSADLVALVAAIDQVSSLVLPDGATEHSATRPTQGVS